MFNLIPSIRSRSELRGRRSEVRPGADPAADASLRVLGDTRCNASSILGDADGVPSSSSNKAARMRCRAAEFRTTCHFLSTSSLSRGQALIRGRESTTQGQRYVHKADEYWHFDEWADNAGECLPRRHPIGGDRHCDRELEVVAGRSECQRRGTCVPESQTSAEGKPAGLVHE